MAMALSMIVEITSLTPRVTFSTPAMPAHSAPVATPARTSARMWNTPPLCSLPPT